MPSLCVLVQEPLSFVMLPSDIGESIDVRRRVYKKRPIPCDELVFYDWIIGQHDIVGGLEVHLAPDDSLLHANIPLAGVSLIEMDCFVRIWFGKVGVGHGQGKEAFGDIHFFGTESNDLAIVVGLDRWLTPAQRASLIEQLGEEKVSESKKGS